jgi:outer membrane murein-binding lipoprotein Lpp
MDSWLAMMILGAVILGALGVWFIIQEIRRISALRRTAEIQRLEQKVKELNERIKQLEGRPRAMVVARGGEYLVTLGTHELGVAKARYDADLHANVINNALQGKRSESSN